MINSLKKITFNLSIFLVLGFGSLQASDGIRALNCWQNCYDDCICDGCGEFFLGGDFLYLRAFEGGLGNACDSVRITDSFRGGTPVSTLDGKGHDPNFNWNPGFRVGLGYEFSNGRGWIGSFWTHYNGQTHGNPRNNHHKWELQYNVIDTVYGYGLLLSNQFSLTPYFGVKVAFINQRLKTHFVNTVSGITASNFIVNGNMKENFFGVGPLFGVEGDLILGCGFSLYGNIAVSGIYGTFHTHSRFLSIYPTGINNDNLKQNRQACQAVVDGGIGIRWKKMLCWDTMLVAQVGLEQHRYFNLNQFGGYGDLCLDGVSCGLGIEF